MRIVKAAFLACPCSLSVAAPRSVPNPVRPFSLARPSPKKSPACLHLKANPFKSAKQTPWPKNIGLRHSSFAAPLFLANAALLYTQAIEAEANHFPMDFCSPNIAHLTPFSARVRGPRCCGGAGLSRPIRPIWGAGAGEERRKGTSWGKGRASEAW